MDLLLSYCRGVLLSFQWYAELCLSFGISQARWWRLIRVRLPKKADTPCSKLEWRHQYIECVFLLNNLPPPRLACEEYRFSLNYLPWITCPHWTTSSLDHFFPGPFGPLGPLIQHVKNIGIPWTTCPGLLAYTGPLLPWTTWITWPTYPACEEYRFFLDYLPWITCTHWTTSSLDHLDHFAHLSSMWRISVSLARGEGHWVHSLPLDHLPHLR